MSEERPSEEIIAYFARATRDAIKKYHEEVVEPRFKKYDEELASISTLLKRLEETVEAVKIRVKMLGELEESAIYQATKAVASARLTKELEDIAQRIADLVVVSLDIRKIVSSVLEDMIPSIKESVSKTTVKIDERHLNRVLNKMMAEVFEKQIEPRLAHIITLVEENKRLVDRINSLNQNIREVIENIAKLQQSIDNVIIRVGKLEEEFSKMSSEVKALRARREEEGGEL